MGECGYILAHCCTTLELPHTGDLLLKSRFLKIYYNHMSLTGLIELIKKVSKMASLLNNYSKEIKLGSH
jgi:hypothetical protein